MKTLLALLLLCAPALAETPTQAIKSKDGASCAAQFDDAIRVNVRPECRRELAPIVAAIRYAENGRAGREYGILHPRVKPTYRSQAGWCAATVQKNYDRWKAAGKPGTYIKYLGAKYCLLDDPRDKNGLNQHWVRNVTYYAKKFKPQG